MGRETGFHGPGTVKGWRMIRRTAILHPSFFLDSMPQRRSPVRNGRFPFRLRSAQGSVWRVAGIVDTLGVWLELHALPSVREAGHVVHVLPYGNFPSRRSCRFIAVSRVVWRRVMQTQVPMRGRNVNRTVPALILFSEGRRCLHCCHGRVRIRSSCHGGR